MENFKEIIRHCNRTSEISAKVIDEFLIYHAAAKYKIDEEITKLLAPFKHVTKQLPREWENRIKSQYIAHRIFRNGGYISKIMAHSAVRNRTLEELAYLELQRLSPWHFSFSFITDNPYKDFYLMEDVFRDEEFLLYSPGTTEYLKSENYVLWLNLIADNGSCWQSFGPISPYKSFDPDDIFFFATEVNPDIEDEDDLIANVEYNPVPYMMLFSGGNYPVVAAGDDVIVHTIAVYDVNKLDTKSLTASFTSEYNQGIYRLGLKRWKGHPHFAVSWYNEEEKKVVLSAMTDRGFNALVKGLNKYGCEFSSDPSVRVKPSMVETASDIFKRKITLADYDSLFEKKTTPDAKEHMKAMNRLLDMLMADINAGLKPDPAEYARKTGVNPETAKSIVASALGSFNKMNKKYGR